MENVKMRNMKFLDEISKDRIDRQIKIYEEDIEYLRKRKEEVTKVVDITWNDATITHEKADSISFDDKKFSINYKDEVILIPLKNVKKLKFAESLLKSTYRWSWNPKTYVDSTSDKNPYASPFVWYKYSSNTDTAGNPIW